MENINITYNIENDIEYITTIILNPLIKNGINNNPFLIAFEGCDSSGKTTLVNKLNNYFKEKLNFGDEEIYSVKFPTLDLTEILNKNNNSLTTAENNGLDITKLFQKDRASYKFFNKKIYIIDRFNISGNVYSYIRGKTNNQIQLNKTKFNECGESIQPNIYIILFRNFKREARDEYDTEDSKIKQKALFIDEIDRLCNSFQYYKTENKLKDIIILIKI